MINSKINLTNKSVLLTILTFTTIIFFSANTSGIIGYSEANVYLNVDEDSEVSVPNPSLLKGKSTATWNIWVKQDEYTDKAALFGEYTPETGGRSFLIRTVLNNSISFVLSNDGVNTALETSATNLECGIRNNSEWTMITITYDGKNNQLNYYHNGIICDTDYIDVESIYDSNQDLEIGSGNKIHFKGSIDDGKIYNTFLDEKQVARLYDESIHGKGLGVGITALVYHEIKDNATKLDEVSTADFQEQMKFLKAKGFRPINFEEFDKWQRGEIELPERAILIIFDDNRKSVYTKAYPILKTYGYKGNVAIVTRYANFTGNDSGYMNWNDLKVLNSSGWGFQSHSLDHFKFNLLSDSAINSQLKKSKEIIDNQLKTNTTAFVFPFYATDERLTNLCAKYYETCWTTSTEVENPLYIYESTDGHAYGKTSDIYTGLKRITIRSDTKIEDFKAIFGRDIGMVGQWRISEGEGNITKDTSGNNRNANIKDAIWGTELSN